MPPSNLENREVEANEGPPDDLCGDWKRRKLQSKMKSWDGWLGHRRFLRKRTLMATIKLLVELGNLTLKLAYLQVGAEVRRRISESWSSLEKNKQRKLLHIVVS